jgi:hypothetical protein
MQIDQLGAKRAQPYSVTTLNRRSSLLTMPGLLGRQSMTTIHLLGYR